MLGMLETTEEGQRELTLSRDGHATECESNSQGDADIICAICTIAWLTYQSLSRIPTSSREICSVSEYLLLLITVRSMDYNYWLSMEGIMRISLGLSVSRAHHGHVLPIVTLSHLVSIGLNFWFSIRIRLLLLFVLCTNLAIKQCDRRIKSSIQSTDRTSETDESRFYAFSPELVFWQISLLERNSTCGDIWKL